MEKNIKKERIYVYNWATRLYARDRHDTVSQHLYCSEEKGWDFGGSPDLNDKSTTSSALAEVLFLSPASPFPGRLWGLEGLCRRGLMHAPLTRMAEQGWAPRQGWDSGGAPAILHTESLGKVALGEP